MVFLTFTDLINGLNTFKRMFDPKGSNKGFAPNSVCDTFFKVLLNKRTNKTLKYLAAREMFWQQNLRVFLEKRGKPTALEKIRSKLVIEIYLTLCYLI